MNCSFCNLEFEAVARPGCGGCSKLAGGCRLVCCPRCHYEMPEPLALPKFLAKLFEGRARQAALKPAPAAGSSLAALEVGAKALIVKLDASDPARAKKLLALGILPGARVEVERRSPAFVIRLGHSRFALDEVLAATVQVRLAPAAGA